MCKPTCEVVCQQVPVNTLTFLRGSRQLGLRPGVETEDVCKNVCKEECKDSCVELEKSQTRTVCKHLMKSETICLPKDEYKCERVSWVLELLGLL